MVPVKTYQEQLIQRLGCGYMSSSAYDTAWVARLGDIDKEISSQALEWLRSNQLPDGSWGCSDFEYHHDRLLCTLSAAIALAKFGKNGDRARIERALPTLSRWIARLREDPAGETIGFELLIPTVLDEAIQLNLLRLTPDIIGLRDRFAAQRTLKLVALPDKLINRRVTVAFSSEMVGMDAQLLLDVENLQEVNGSVAHSPSATSFYTLHIRPGDEAALHYLRGIVHPDEGGAPYIGPIDIFEIAWGLWNFALAWSPSSLLPVCSHLVDIVEQAWLPDFGSPACTGSSLVDGDDTAIAFDVLSRYGRSPNIEAIFGYETGSHFRCFPLEANPSISTNIHILNALYHAGLDEDHPAIQKICRFLRGQRIGKAYWHDKWHSSPYYTTAHAVIACAERNPQLVKKAADWILYTQNLDGSWGFYLPTAEETAYALQGLVMWRRAGYPVPKETIERGAMWLQNHIDPPYPMLWIGKCLYSPDNVVTGAILSALELAEQESRSSDEGH